MLETIKQSFLTGLRFVLPEEIEEKFGIAEDRKAMVFPITEEGRKKIQEMEAPGTYIKYPFIQKEFRMPAGPVEAGIKEAVEAPERITKTLTRELPALIKEPGKLPKPEKGKLYDVEGFAERAKNFRDSLIEQGFSSTRAVVATILNVGGQAIIDVVFVGSMLQLGAEKLAQGLTPGVKEKVASWKLLGQPKTMADASSSVKQLQRQFHPDLIGDNIASTQINNAYNVLKQTGLPSKWDLAKVEVSSAAQKLIRPISQWQAPAVSFEPLPLKELPGVAPEMPQPAFGLTIEKRLPVEKIPNLERIKAPLEIKELIKSTSVKYTPLIDEARRGIITHQQTQVMAESLGLTTDKLLERTKGEALNAEELLAARQVIVSSANNVYELGKVARETGSDQALVNFQNALKKHSAIQAEVQGATAEAGRALSAMRIEAGPTKNYKEMLKALGGRELTEEIAERIAKIDPDDFLAVNKFIRDVSKAKTADKVFEYWVNAILSHPTTHLVNTLSNSLVRLAKIPTRTAAVGLDLLRATLTGTPRERFLGEAAADIVGMTIGFREGVRRAMFAFKEELPPETITKLEVRPGAIKGVKGKVIRTPGTFLIAADEFFKAINSQAELHAQAYRKAIIEKGQDRAKRMAELIENPTPEMIEAAKAEELYRTFQKELGKAGKALTRFRNRVPLLKYIIPFLRTPINIAKFGLEMTPLNFLRLGVQKLKGKYSGAEFTDELSKPVIGSIIAAMTAYYAAEGKITGHAPTDKEQRDAFYREGKLPYSIQIGDRWFSYARLEPIGTVVGMVADFVQDFEILKEEEQSEKIKAITASLTQNIINKTYMSGLSNMFNALTDPTRYGSDWIENFASGFIPNIARVPTEMIDPYFRRPEGIVDAFKKKIPGLSKDVPPVRNVWGEKAERDISGVISPVRISPVREEAIDQELKRLDYEMGFPSKTIRGFKLDAKHYDIYQRTTGRKIKQILDKLITDKAYLVKLDDRGKKKAIQQVVDGVRERFRDEMLFWLFCEQVDVEIPNSISQEKAAQVFYALLKEPEFKEASNEKKREYYVRNLHRFITK